MDAESLLRGLALAIAEVSDQGTSRKRVAPEVLSQRKKAEERMWELIETAVGLCNGDPNHPDAPVYELTAKQYLAEQLIDPFWRGADHAVRATRISWFGAPNDGMKPVSPASEEIYLAYKESRSSTDYSHAKGGVHGVAPPGERQMKVTSKGITVHGQERPHVAQVGADPNIPPSAGMAILGRRAEGEVKEVAVLGTIAPKARQVA